MSEITGATFPVPKGLMPRFFAEGKTVFIKPATAFKELRSGMKLIFYQSREDTGYAGEATTRSRSSIPSATFLTREEAKAYVEGQERWQGVQIRKEAPRRRPWMALELEDIQEYDTVKKPDRFVPVGGRYLRE